MTSPPNGAPRLESNASARALLRWQFKCVHEFLDAVAEQLLSERELRHPSRPAPAAAVSYAHVVVTEDLAVNGVLGGGTPLALSTWLGRTGLSELPPCLVAADWNEWARRVRLDPARLPAYAQAVSASTDAYIGTLSEDACDPVRRDGLGRLLGALVLTLCMRAGEIACLVVLPAVPGLRSR